MRIIILIDTQNYFLTIIHSFCSHYQVLGFCFNWGVQSMKSHKSQIHSYVCTVFHYYKLAELSIVLVIYKQTSPLENQDSYFGWDLLQK